MRTYTATPITIYSNYCRNCGGRGWIEYKTTVASTTAPLSPEIWDKVAISTAPCPKCNPFGNYRLCGY